MAPRTSCLNPSTELIEQDHDTATLEGYFGRYRLCGGCRVVGIEMRNSTQQAVLATQALEIASYQGLMGNIVAMNASALDNPELAALLYKAYYTDERLSDLEQYRMNRDRYLRFRHGDMAFFHYQRGVISEDRLLSALEILRLYDPAVVEFWREREDTLVEPYRKYINNLIEAEAGAN